ncbi:MAG: helix-turn-helix transcriptional regulator [Gammaproteobacteria bacterium]|nr:helix-turn-helix transcriptional regulator [Gammaproteobacteria bacterium]
MNLDSASSNQIESALCQRLDAIRLAHNLTQEALANRAGISLRTLGRLLRGEGTTLDSFIRVLAALGLQGNLETLLPDPAIRPVDRVKKIFSRRRARPTAEDREAPASWQWKPDSGDAH